MQEVKKGDRVSLNVRKRSFYFQEGDGGITLIAGQTEMAIIPNTATEKHLQQINMAIRNNHLIMGWPEKEMDDSEKEIDIKTLLNAGRNKINDWIYELREDKGIRNGVKISKLEKLIELEKIGKNRKSVIDKAESTLDSIGGISKVIDSDQEKLEIKLTSGTEEIPENK